ncbi:MAG: prepilin-type N-terminal cleavage/methylation domain-containing protein [Planctomycetota bacterium]
MSFRRGFSLIELVIVLVILGIIAGFATQRLRGVTARKSLADATDRIRAFDTALRREALVNRKPVAARIDRGSSMLIVRSSPTQEFRLPGRVTIQSIVMGREFAGPQDSLMARSDGASQSYAIELRCDESTRWVMVAGGSGQMKVFADRQAVAMLLGG